MNSAQNICLSCSSLNIPPFKLLISDNKEKQQIQGLFEGLCFKFRARFRRKCSLSANFKIILLAFPGQKKYFTVWGTLTLNFKVHKKSKRIESDERLISIHISQTYHLFGTKCPSECPLNLDKCMCDNNTICEYTIKDILIYWKLLQEKQESYNYIMATG